MSTQQEDLAVLVPAPKVFKVGGEEIRVQPLPVKRLIAVIKFVEQNADLLSRAEEVLKAGVSTALETEVYPRLNKMIRLVVTPVDRHEFLTDEWCAEHMSNSHYRAVLMTVIRQNELEAVFSKAKAFLGVHMDGALRQAEKLMGPIALAETNSVS